MLIPAHSLLSPLKMVGGEKNHIRISDCTNDTKWINSVTYLKLYFVKFHQCVNQSIILEMNKKSCKNFSSSKWSLHLNQHGVHRILPNTMYTFGYDIYKTSSALHAFEEQELLIHNSRSEVSAHQIIHTWFIRSWGPQGSTGLLSKDMMEKDWNEKPNISV